MVENITETRLRDIEARLAQIESRLKMAVAEPRKPPRVEQKR